MAALYFDATGLAYSFDDGHIAVRTVHSVKHVPTHQSSITRHGKVALSVKYVAAHLSSITTIPSGTDCQICHELRHCRGHSHRWGFHETVPIFSRNPLPAEGKRPRTRKRPAPFVRRGHFSLAKRGFRPNFGSRPRALGHGLRPRLRTSRWPWSGYAASGGALGKASVLVSLRPRVKLGSRKFNCWDSVNSV